MASASKSTGKPQNKTLQRSVLSTRVSHPVFTLYNALLVNNLATTKRKKKEINLFFFSLRHNFLQHFFFFFWFQDASKTCAGFEFTQTPRGVKSVLTVLVLETPRNVLGVWSEL